MGLDPLLGDRIAPICGRSTRKPVSGACLCSPPSLDREILSSNIDVFSGQPKQLRFGFRDGGHTEYKIGQLLARKCSSRHGGKGIPFWDRRKDGNNLIHRQHHDTEGEDKHEDNDVQ